MRLPTLAISIGDLNGVGIEIALKAHAEISEICIPVYCINAKMLQKAVDILGVDIPDDFYLFEVEGDFEIKAGELSKSSGQYSYDSFRAGMKLCKIEDADALVTLPINKEAWKLADLDFVGHTDVLRKYFKQDAIMMLGCQEMYVALYTEHIPLKEVASTIEAEKLAKFLLDLHKSIGDKKVAVLGLNPHAGDNGVLGDEEEEITKAIAIANELMGKELFIGPIVPDIAFTPHFRKEYNYFVAMYHDQGLAPLKALYFDESINVSLNLPIIRTSVDHGTAFDIAYQGKAQTLSYLNAVKSALAFIEAKNV